MGPRVFALIILGLILVGCEEAAEPSSPSLLTPGQAAATSAPSPGLPNASLRGALAPDSRLRHPSAQPSPPTSVAVTRRGCYTGPMPDGIPSGARVHHDDHVERGSRPRGPRSGVYGVTVCLSATPDAGSGSCLVVDTSVPADVRKLDRQGPCVRRHGQLDGPHRGRMSSSSDTGGAAFTAIGVDRPRRRHLFRASWSPRTDDAGTSKFDHRRRGDSVLRHRLRGALIGSTRGSQAQRPDRRVWSVGVPRRAISRRCRPRPRARRAAPP